MIVNEQGIIIADLGIRWGRYVTEDIWWSVEPFGYRIRPEQHLWLLFRPDPAYGIQGRTVDQKIYLGYTYEECMRVAEIYEIKRVCPNNYVIN